MSRIQRVAFGWVVILAGLLAVHVFVPQRSGPVALSEVLEPYIVLTGLIAAVVAVRAQSTVARIVVAVFVVVVLGRYAPGWISLPATLGGSGSP